MRTPSPLTSSSSRSRLYSSTSITRYNYVFRGCIKDWKKFEGHSRLCLFATIFTTKLVTWSVEFGGWTSKLIRKHTLCSVSPNCRSRTPRHGGRPRSGCSSCWGRWELLDFSLLFVVFCTPKPKVFCYTKKDKFANINRRMKTWSQTRNRRWSRLKTKRIEILALTMSNFEHTHENKNCSHDYWVVRLFRSRRHASATRRASSRTRRSTTTSCRVSAARTIANLETLAPIIIRKQRFPFDLALSEHLEMKHILPIMTQWTL